MNYFEQYFPQHFSLQTSIILLRPLEKKDLDQFILLTSPSPWQYFSKQLNIETELSDWVNQAITERINQARVPFTIIEKSTGNSCGSTSYGNISFYDQRLEIGWTWLAEQYQGTGINFHSKFALLKFAFETLLFERVEIKTDNLNERAKQALRKIGAREEGVLRSHMLMPGGRRRDSIYFSILKNEWTELKQTVFKNIG